MDEAERRAISDAEAAELAEATSEGGEVTVAESEPTNQEGAASE